MTVFTTCKSWKDLQIQIKERYTPYQFIWHQSHNSIGILYSSLWYIELANLELISAQNLISCVHVHMLRTRVAIIHHVLNCHLVDVYVMTIITIVIIIYCHNIVSTSESEERYTRGR